MCVQVMFGGIVATAAGIVPVARHDVLLLGEQVALQKPEASVHRCIAHLL